MQNINKLVIILILFITSAGSINAFSPMGRKFGAGIVLGEPTGLTLKIWSSNSTAFALSIGNSYLGNIRFGGDYLFHFNAFNSKIVNLYVGPGIAVGVGESGGWIYRNDNKYWYKEKDDIGFGVRGVMGINIVPTTVPFEFFVELGLMVGVSPNVISKLEGGLGFRYYFN